MNLHTLYLLNDKLQARLQAQNLEGVSVTLDEMKAELGEIKRRKAIEDYRAKHPGCPICQHKRTQ